MEEEIKDRQHLGMTIRQWMVELHGTLRIGIGRRIDGVIDKMQKDTFLDQKIRVWNNGSVEILLPDVNNDILFVFTHILQHYFRGGENVPIDVAGISGNGSHPGDLARDFETRIAEDPRVQI